jgi:carbonic anhydrase
VHGFAVACGVTVATGVLLLILARLGVARLALAVSPAVLRGMVASIGALVALSQVNVILGGEGKGGAWSYVVALAAGLRHPHHGACTLAAASLSVIVAWGFLPKSWRVLRYLAPMVVAALLSQFGGIEAPLLAMPRGDFAWQWPALPAPEALPGFAGAVAVAAVIIAVYSVLNVAA